MWRYFPRVVEQYETIELVPVARSRSSRSLRSESGDKLANQYLRHDAIKRLRPDLIEYIKRRRTRRAPRKKSPRRSKSKSKSKGGRTYRRRVL